MPLRAERLLKSPISSLQFRNYLHFRVTYPRSLSASISRVINKTTESAVAGTEKPTKFSYSIRLKIKIPIVLFLMPFISYFPCLFERSLNCTCYHYYAFFFYLVSGKIPEAKKIILKGIWAFAITNSSTFIIYVDYKLLSKSK